MILSFSSSSLSKPTHGGTAASTSMADSNEARNNHYTHFSQLSHIPLCSVTASSHHHTPSTCGLVSLQAEQSDRPLGMVHARLQEVYSGRGRGGGGGHLARSGAWCSQIFFVRRAHRPTRRRPKRHPQDVAAHVSANHRRDDARGAQKKVADKQPVRHCVAALALAVRLRRHRRRGCSAPPRPDWC